MPNRKRLLALLTILALLMPASQATAQINVLACEPEWAALAEAIGKEHVEVNSATTAFQDPHHIEARPSLIARARRADLLFCTGADLEVGWLPLLLRQSGNARIQPGKPGHLMAADQVDLIEKLERVDRSMGDIHGAGNPHLHLDPRRLLVVARELTARLKAIDPDRALAYQSRFDTFATRWEAAMAVWEDRARPLQGKKVIVQHRSWSYLLNWLGMEAVADLEPKPGLPPTSGHLAGLLKVIDRGQPAMILIAAYHNDRGARWLERRSDVPVVTLPYTVGGTEQARDLFSLYDSTLDLLLNEAGE